MKFLDKEKPNRKTIHYYIKSYIDSLKLKEKTFIDPNDLHPKCSLRSPQTCRAKYPLVSINIAGEDISLCTSCAAHIKLKAKQVFDTKPQAHYWQGRSLFKKETIADIEARKIEQAKEKVCQKGKGHRPFTRNKMSKLVSKPPIF